MVTAQYQAALHSYAEGRYEEAMRQFSGLLYEDPRNPKLHIWLGATFRKAGKIEYAKVQYQQVLSLTDDPDLLDLASTSLAQIQNQIASTNFRDEKRSTQIDLKDRIPSPSQDRSTTLNSNSADTGRVGDNNGNHFNERNSKATLGSKERPKSGIEINQILTDSDSTISDSTISDSTISSENLLAKEPIEKGSATISDPHTPQLQLPNAKGNLSIGAVPPPPSIAASLRTKLPTQQVRKEFEVRWDEKAQAFIDCESPEVTQSSKLTETIAIIENASKQEEEKERHKNLNIENHQGLKDEILTDKSNKRDKSDKDKDVFKVQDRNKKQSSKPIALEDMFKFSSVGQKITLYGAAVATIPAIALGLAAYQVGDSLLLSKINQGQQSQAIALAKTAKSFLKQQTTDVEVLKKLLVSAESGQNPTTSNLAGGTNKGLKSLASLPIAQQRQYKQQLTNRLNLYSQAYPQYTSIAMFSPSGELIAQSSRSKALQVLKPSIVSKVESTDNVLLTDPIVGNDGAFFYAVSLVKSSISTQGTPPINMILQVEIPVKKMAAELASNGFTSDGSSSFYVIDSNNNYIASSQPVTIGADATTDFAMLPDLRSSQSNDLGANVLKDVANSDRNVQILAYAPIPNVQSYGLLNWDVIITTDKATAIAGNQSLLLAIGLGIASTPLLVAAIAFGLSRNLSARLKNIRLALSELRLGSSNNFSEISDGTLPKASFKMLNTEGNDELSEISSSINKMSGQFQTMVQKQEQEQQRLQLQVVKLFKVLSKLAREETQEIQEADLSDENILKLGKKVRAEMLQRNAEVQSYRQQKEKIQKQLMQMLRDVHALADGDLTVKTKAIDGNLVDVAIFFDDVMSGLQNIVGQVKSSANQVNFSLGQNEQAIANLASVSQRQIDTVTRSLNTAQMSKLSATTIANHSQQAIQSSLMVAEKISDGDRSISAVMEKVGQLQGTVSNTAKRIKHLGEASQKISKAISSINEIAIKTNFLAINATLEASRNGDMGVGFAIVAEEVGELASRSVAATKEIENMLSNIQIETNAVMAAVESGSNQASESSTLAIAAKDSLQQIAQISQQIDGLMSSIADATASQVQSSEGVANLMQDLSHFAKRTLTSSTEVSKFMKATKQYSGDLQQSLAHFKT